VIGGVGVCDGFSVAERLEERTKCADLISGFRLPFGVGRESVLQKLFPEPVIPTMRAMCQPKRDVHSPKNHRTTASEDDRLRPIPTPHDEIHLCGQLIKMREMAEPVRREKAYWYPRSTSPRNSSRRLH